MKKNKTKKTKQRICRIFLNNFRIVFKVARMAPDFFVMMIIDGIISGLLNSAEAVFTLHLFDSLDRGETFENVAMIIGIMAGFFILILAFDAFKGHYLIPVAQQRMELKLHRELFEKAQKLDIACYDDPEFYNDFVWAMDESGWRAFAVFNDLSGLIRSIVAGGTLFTLMLSIDVWISIALLAVSALTVVIRQIGNKLGFEQGKERKKLWRVRSYINRVYHLPDYAKEIRLSNVSDLLMDKLDENTEAMEKNAKKYGIKYFILYGLCQTILSNLVYYGVLFYMFVKLLNGDVLVGAFAASVGMIWRVRWLLGDLVQRITEFAKHSLFLEKYYGFLAYKPRTVSGDKVVPSFGSLEIRDVSFTYDFSDKPRYEFNNKENSESEAESKEVLHGINMSLKKGEKIAIVGYNGAGKTTLIKLLMRLYDPSSGQIMLNGTDIREYDINEYRNKIGVVFQDFKIFATTIADNVINGAFCEKDRETVIRALDAAGFSEKLSSLEKGIDTVLTREFDDKGTNLSGGEAQKVAIARVFAKPFELIIMDEPSSALDPIAEYELNQAITEYAADKTVIFISHRLSTTRMADRIYMFADGELSETGSHDELMALGGKYAEMFEIQAENYKKQ